MVLLCKHQSLIATWDGLQFNHWYVDIVLVVHIIPEERFSPVLDQLIHGTTEMYFSQPEHYRLSYVVVSIVFCREECAKCD